MDLATVAVNELQPGRLVLTTGLRQSLKQGLVGL